MSGRLGDVRFRELGPPGTDQAIGVFSGHLDDAFLSDGDMPAGERLDRADPLRRLEADIDRLRRFQFFGHFPVVFEDALAGERLLEPVEELGGGVDPAGGTEMRRALGTTLAGDELLAFAGYEPD